MSDATEREAPEAQDPQESHADAWERACAEDLAAEKARRHAQYGPPPGSAAEELRKLFDVVSDKLSGLQAPLLGAVAQGAVEQTLRQVAKEAKAVVEPVIERNPDVFDHLAAAGSELLAAYRSAVEGQESRWTRGDVADDTSKDATKDPSPGRDPRDGGSSAGEHIDLD
ncbi:DUF5304 domain-containing protein [Streptomyces venezuelae]|uniref:DUF5304 domain-containing protein n=1 Tax=Streptomyces venezuelae TaxID=54571 RepID=UPI003661300B